MFRGFLYGNKLLTLNYERRNIMNETTTFKKGKRHTQTTTYYKDGKVKAILSITTIRKEWKPLLQGDVHETIK